MNRNHGRIALVGIGKIARDQHLPAIAADADWELAATVSRHASVDGVEAFTDIASLLVARPDIDTISLAVPAGPRFDLARRAIEAGRHVMLEKPPGLTVAECRTLEKLARQQKVTVFATWHARHADGVEEARRWLCGKRLLQCQINWKEDVRVWHPDQEWVWQAGGLGVFDPGINALSMMTAILSEPVHLQSAELAVPANRQTPIAATLSFVHPQARSVKAAFDWAHPGEPLWEMLIQTDQGTRHLSFGAASMDVEYQRLYRRMSELISAGEIDMDLSPLMHVADAFLLGQRTVVEAFHF